MRKAHSAGSNEIASRNPDCLVPQHVQESRKPLRRNQSDPVNKAVWIIDSLMNEALAIPRVTRRLKSNHRHPVNEWGRDKPRANPQRKNSL